MISKTLNHGTNITGPFQIDFEKITYYFLVLGKTNPQNLLESLQTYDKILNITSINISHANKRYLFFFFQISVPDCAMYPSFFIHLASQLWTLFSDSVVYPFFFYLLIVPEKLFTVSVICPFFLFTNLAMFDIVGAFITVEGNTTFTRH